VGARYFLFLGRHRLRLPAALAIFAMLMSCLAACGGTSGASSQATPGQPPITIGASLTLSGAGAAQGQATLQGYQLWTDAMNKQGGLLGREVRLAILPDSGDPQQAAANYEKLIGSQHVDLVFGPSSPQLVAPALAVAARAGLAFPEAVASSDALFAQSGASSLAALPVPMSTRLSTFAYYILSLPQSQRPKTVAYATEGDSELAAQVAGARKLLELGGVRTVYSTVYTAASSTDYSQIGSRIAASQAQVVVLGAQFADSVALIKAFEQSHYNPQALVATAGPDQSPHFSQAVGSHASEGIFAPALWTAQLATFANPDLLSAYSARYHGGPQAIGAAVALGYAVGQVLGEAVKKVGKLDRRALLQELHSDSFDSVIGAVTFDQSGRNTGTPPYLLQWQRGALITVAPYFVAAENPEFPKPQWP
jgi:branched-chain amino acid transport system substrate-binding protein